MLISMESRLGSASLESPSKDGATVVEAGEEVTTGSEPIGKSRLEVEEGAARLDRYLAECLGLSRSRVVALIEEITGTTGWSFK